MRRKLTDKEWNLVSNLTYRTLLDESFDIGRYSEEDYFYDFENCTQKDLQWGFEMIDKYFTYPFQYEGYTKEAAKILADLLKEFAGISEEEYNWRMREE